MTHSPLDNLHGLTADGSPGREIYTPRPVAYHSAVRRVEKRWRAPLRRRVWRWLLARVWWV